jgi:Zn-dependent M16 (insulinase) family peptidase
MFIYIFIVFVILQGWHFELENAADPLTYKGVVYNEMKGVYSSPGKDTYIYTYTYIYAFM